MCLQTVFDKKTSFKENQVNFAQNCASGSTTQEPGTWACNQATIEKKIQGYKQEDKNILKVSEI